MVRLWLSPDGIHSHIRGNLFNGEGAFHASRRDPMVFRRKKEEAENVEECSVSGCHQPVKRSFSPKPVKAALPELTFKSSNAKRVRLCKEHYKDYKKATKEDRKLQRLGWER